MSCDFEDIINCPVCFEPYTETGEHVPRILPCYDTLCQKCIGKLLRENTITCPECRVKHYAMRKKGVLSFQQNKYILASIRKASVSLKKRQQCKSPSGDSCEKHSRERSLFCCSSCCLGAICPLCLSQDHRNHDVVDLLQGREEIYNLMLEESQTIKENLQFAKDELEYTKKQLENKHADCVTAIKDQWRKHMMRIKEILNQRFNKLISDATVQKKTVNSIISAEITGINELMDDLKRKNKTAVRLEESPEDALKAIRSIASNVDRKCAGEAAFQFYFYQTRELSSEDIEKACGDLIMKDMNGMLSEPEEYVEECTEDDGYSD